MGPWDLSAWLCSPGMQAYTDLEKSQNKAEAKDVKRLIKFTETLGTGALEINPSEIIKLYNAAKPLFQRKPK